ncbi:MAG: hypothetical protein CNLJKLNK_00744 [Holosporales bacterium]
MINLCSLSSSILLCFISLLTITSLFFTEIGRDHRSVIIILFSMLTALCFLQFRLFRCIRTATQAAIALKNGDFEKRIVMPREGFLIKNFIVAFNGMLDVADAFVRESSLAMKAVSEDRFYRKIRPEGLKGAYAVAVSRINNSIDIICKKAKIEKENAENSEMLKNNLVFMINEVKNGNLELRLDDNPFSEHFKPLIKDLNLLMEAISHPIQESMITLKKIATGDFSSGMEGEYSGIFKDLQSEFETTTKNLSVTLSKINRIALSVNKAAESIVVSAQEVSEKTESQASALEQTAASLEELSATVKGNAEHAQESEHLAQKTQTVVYAANETMKETIHSMGNIESSAKKINGIIQVIEEIAFQTNILALNASIEAARAGQAGSGFAVVAAEVRSLAQRSTEASQDIKKLIETSRENIKTGVDLVNKTGNNLLEIKTSIDNVSFLLSEITNASVEQSMGLEQINTAVCQLDNATQRTAINVNENYTCASQLNTMADGLRKMVCQFKLMEVT